MRFFVLNLVFFTTLLASVDSFYKKIYDYLDQSVTSLDKFLSRDYNSTLEDRFSFRIYLDTINEEAQGNIYKFGIKANIRLSRTIQKLNLFLEDFRNKENINTNTQNSVANSIQDNSYLLGLQYLTSTFLRYRAGIKIRSLTPDPFVSVGAEKSSGSQKWWFHYGARVMYSIKREFDDRVFLNFNSRLGERLLLSQTNTLRYEQRSDDRYQETNALKLYYSPSRYQLLSGGVSAYFASDKLNDLALRYYYTGIDYSDRIFRPWIFYQISPGFVFRKERDFDPSFRILFRIGITFEKY
jgi:hypothetical protein